MMLTCLYFAVCTTLLVANNFDQDFIEENYYLPFHYTEFWGAFAFTLIEAFILVSADVLKVESIWQKLQLLLVGVNIVGSMVAALLFSFAPYLFERDAHFIEYSIQVTITAANFIFIFNSPRKKADVGSGSRSFGFWFQVILNIVLLFMAVLKILFYTSVISSEFGPERASHYFEFIGEMVNSAWAFIFAVRAFFKLSDSQKEHDARLKTN